MKEDICGGIIYLRSIIIFTMVAYLLFDTFNKEAA